jgi:dihydrofolate reductase
VTSLPEAITQAQMICEHKNLTEIFIIGGAEIYQQTLPIVDRLYLTRIHQDYAGDVLFPPLDLSHWSIAETHAHDLLTFEIYDRAVPSS